MAMLMVNGAAVPAPSTMRLTLFDLSSAQERNAAGELVLDRVAVKRRIDLSWARIGSAALASLLAAMNGGFFQASYPDPATGEMRSMTCCCADRTAGVLRMEDGAAVWTNVEMSWTEK